MKTEDDLSDQVPDSDLNQPRNKDTWQALLESSKKKSPKKRRIPKDSSDEGRTDQGLDATPVDSTVK